MPRSHRVMTLCSHHMEVSCHQKMHGVTVLWLQSDWRRLSEAREARSSLASEVTAARDAHAAAAQRVQVR